MMQAVEAAKPTGSFPFLNYAKEHNLDYAQVLTYADVWGRGIAYGTDPTRYRQAAAVLEEQGHMKPIRTLWREEQQRRNNVLKAHRALMVK
jgi:hypothetical protein